MARTLAELQRSMSCPICYDLYTHPVMAADGITYCKACITTWIQARHMQRRPPISPMTNLVLETEELRLNMTVQQAVSEFKEVARKMGHIDQREDSGKGLAPAGMHFRPSAPPVVMVLPPQAPGLLHRTHVMMDSSDTLACRLPVTMADLQLLPAAAQKQVLGQELHAKLGRQMPWQVLKTIVSALLEKDPRELLVLLSSDRCLQETAAKVHRDIDKAKVLSKSKEEQKHIFSGCLYTMISRLEPKNAGKITSLLLEKSCQVLTDALDSPTLLIGLVDEAVDLLLQEEVSRLMNLGEEERWHELGSRLYPMVQKTQPSRTDKITGMLLELELKEILKMLDSESLLASQSREAFEVLMAAEA